MPPVLAGREKEKARLKLALDDLGAGLQPTENIALIGPRGNGKTALLRWVELYARRLDGKVGCIDLNPACFQSYQSLAEERADPGVLSSLVGDGLSATISLFGSEIGFSRQASAKQLIRHILEKRCSKSGLAILIDEAHTLNRHPDSVRAFFHDLQMLAGGGRPLLLILAGTPSISARLAAIEAAYWDRLDKVGIGRLDFAAAREALQIPLESLGYCIESNILDEAVAAAQCYPYFLQAVGDALYKAAKAETGKLESGNSIGKPILNRALQEFNVRKKNYYAERYRELEREGILSAAEAVAGLFESQKKKPVPSSLIRLAVARSLGANMENVEVESRGEVQDAKIKLRQVGYIWSQIGQEEFCEPGIPSLMDYVAERARDRALAKAKFEAMQPDSASG